MAATTSFAQSSVEIYGIVDQSYTNTTVKVSDPTGNVKVTGVNTGTQSGLATQRIGFRGTEDLGGGLRALFQIESALSAGLANLTDNRDSNGFGTRPTFVGLRGGFGTVTLGRQDTPLLKAVVPQLAGGANNMVGQIMWSPFAVAGDLNGLGDLNNGSTAMAGAIADAGMGRIARQTTIDSAINYATPNFNGLQAEVQVGKSDVKLTGSDVNTTINAKTDDTGLNLRYANGPLTLAAATHSRKAIANGATTSKNDNDYVGATYNFGFAVASLQYGQSKRSSTAAGEVYKNKGTQLGVQVPVSGAVNAFASYGTGSRTFSRTNEYEQTSFQAGATYSFSKRTRIYAIYGQQELKGDNAATRGNKWKENQFGLGVNHSF